jgi:hypothetical protein
MPSMVMKQPPGAIRSASARGDGVVGSVLKAAAIKVRGKSDQGLVLR